METGDDRIGTELHAELCAVLLGDADAATAARIEARLATDPALRAERDRLLRTITAVRDSAAQVASPELAIALPPRQHGGRWLAAAAAVLLLGGGVAYLAAPRADRAAGIAVARGEPAPDALAAGLQVPGSRPSDAGASHAGAGPTGATPQPPPPPAPAATTRVPAGPAIPTPQLRLPVGIGAVTPGSDPRLLAFAPSGPARDAFVGTVHFHAIVPAPSDGTVLFSDYLGQPLDAITATPQADANASSVAPGAGSLELLTLGSAQDTWAYGGSSGLSIVQPGIDAFFRACDPLPGERPRDMYFRFWGDHAFVLTSQDRLATFATDVDTASFVLARRYLRDGVLPERAQVRTEEFVNFFPPDLPAPTTGDLAIHAEVAPSPFGGSPARWLLRVGLRAREVPREARRPLVLTFVVDTSGSMAEGQRIELVKDALRALTGQLDSRDRLGIVAFNNDARLVLPLTRGNERAVIAQAIDELTAQGSTNAEAGLLLGYELAAAADGTEADQTVVLLSDGVANVGDTNQAHILDEVAKHRLAGVRLNTVGVGMNNHNDVFLEQLADGGDGLCDYVDDARAVHRALVDRFTGAFQPVAADVKLQVEFEPGRVLRWRQLGYENRAVADTAFRDDSVDGGEIGSGHQVTALFELETAEGPDAALRAADGFATVHVRWLPPRRAGGGERAASELSLRVGPTALHDAFASASPGFQRAAVVAQLAEVLRRSTQAAGDSWADLVRETERIVQLDALRGDADTAELVSMLHAAERLGIQATPEPSPLADAMDQYRRRRYLQHQLRELSGDHSPAALDELRRENEELERRIRELAERQ
ncbi:MAG: von Willebrand factor type A domain-containing protein [Planctomycetes bacterium]|nr:von Willebrand factor type A domain-containing protein [Planctomycetota bacterium]